MSAPVPVTSVIAVAVRLMTVVTAGPSHPLSFWNVDVGTPEYGLPHTVPGCNHDHDRHDDDEKKKTRIRSIPPSRVVPVGLSSSENLNLATCFLLTQKVARTVRVRFYDVRWFFQPTY